MDFFTGAFATLITVGGYVIAGIFFIIAQFDKAKRERELVDDQTSSRLIGNLKTTTELQEKEIVKLKQERHDQGIEIAHLQGQIKTLTEIMQGRDPAMKAFLDTAPELIRVARENNKMGKETSESVKQMAEAMTSFVARMEEHHASGGG